MTLNNPPCVQVLIHVVVIAFLQVLTRLAPLGVTYLPHGISTKAFTLLHTLVFLCKFFIITIPEERNLLCWFLWFFATSAFQDTHVIVIANFSITAIATPTLTTAESLGSTPGARSILLATIGPAIFSCILQGDWNVRKFHQTCYTD